MEHRARHEIPPREAHGGGKGCCDPGAGGNGLGAPGAEQLRHHEGTTGEGTISAKSFSDTDEGLTLPRPLELTCLFVLSRFPKTTYG